LCLISVLKGLKDEPRGKIRSEHIRVKSLII